MLVWPYTKVKVHEWPKNAEFNGSKHYTMKFENFWLQAAVRIWTKIAKVPAVFLEQYA